MTTVFHQSSTTMEPGDREFKVLHVITGLRRGGAEAVLARLILATQASFEHVVIVLHAEGHFGPILRNAGVTVHAINMGHVRKVPFGLAHMVRLIRRERPDIVQTWLYHADILGGIAARIAGKRPIVWGIRSTNLDSASISRSTRAVAWLGARLSGMIPDAIVCNSIRSAQVHIAFGYRASRFRVIPNGYDVGRFQPDHRTRQQMRTTLGVGSGELLLGTIARWDQQKDHGNLLAAIQTVARRRPAIRLLLVGEGMEQGNARLTAMLRAFNVEHLVTLAGPRDDIPAVMNALDLHILSSRGEAFPNALAEAMACGTPCVATDVGDVARIVGDAGWVVRPEDPAALAVAIETALVALDRPGREALGKQARARIVEQFGLARMTDAYIDLWRDLRRRAG